MLLAWAYIVRAIFLWMTRDATHKTSLWLTWFSDIHFSVDTRGNETTLSTFFLFKVRGDHWLMTWWPIGFVVQFSKQSFVYVGNIVQGIHKMYVVFVLIMSMLTSSNNTRTMHVKFLKFVTATPPFIQPDHEISNRPNLSWVHCLLHLEPCVTSIKLKNSERLPFSMHLQWPCLVLLYKLGQMQALLWLLSHFCWTMHYTLHMLILLAHLLAYFFISWVLN